MPIKAICPVCDQDIEITDDAIRHSIVHLPETNNVLLVSCPNCCRALVPNATGDRLQELSVVLPGQAENWLACVPLLEPQLIQEPNGCNDYQGEKVYRPGDGNDQLRRYPYMFKYGIDPACMWAKMNSGNQQRSFVIK